MPATPDECQAIRHLVHQEMSGCQLVPPLPLGELQALAARILRQASMDPRLVDYTAVLVNNELWHDQLAAVPYQRRGLVLPEPGPARTSRTESLDDFGLPDRTRGHWALMDLHAEAERLGYVILSGEDSGLVMAMIASGRIDAIVGISDLPVLEKAFAAMESAAFPGVAIPLLQTNGNEAQIDLQWARDVIHLTSSDKTCRMDLDAMRREVDAWFTEGELQRLLGPADSRTERIARDWLSRTGKRWRPFLTACTYAALQPDPQAALPEVLKKVAIAVECFHKASLVHDDIEDGDQTRYDQLTVHAAQGVPVALNVGDLLLGEGYRLIGDVEVGADRVAAMLQVAAAAHRDLCLGQGTELCWQKDPKPLACTQVLEIFRRKTAPAFEVALRLGAVVAGATDCVHEVLRSYSENLGIAYQIRDDMEDWFGGEGTPDMMARRPSLMAAMAHERTSGPHRRLINDLWLARAPNERDAHRIRQMFVTDGLTQQAEQLLDAYKQRAIGSLTQLSSATLKGLMRRVVSKIFHDLPPAETGQARAG